MANCGDLILIAVACQISGITVPYLIALHQNTFSPPLPFISQAVASSSVSGIFTCLMLFSCFPGSLFSFALYQVHIREENKYKKYASIVSSFACFSYFLSYILICAYPFKITPHSNKYEWVVVILIGHMLGALIALSSCIVFVVAQAILYWDVKGTKKTLMSRQNLALTVLPTGLLGVTALITVGIEELYINDDRLTRDISYQLPTKFSTAYVITTICEWTLLICMWCSLMMLYEEMNEKEVHIIIKNKSETETKALPEKQSKIVSKYFYSTN